MVTQAEFYGGSDEISITDTPGGYQLAFESPRVIVISAVTGGGGVGYLKLPDARTVRLGAPIFYFLNPISAKDLRIEDAAGNEFGTAIQTGDGSIFLLLDNTTEAGEWIQVYLANIPIL